MYNDPYGPLNEVRFCEHSEIYFILKMLRRAQLIRKHFEQCSARNEHCSVKLSVKYIVVRNLIQADHCFSCEWGI